MAEKGSREPASAWSAYAENVPEIFKETPRGSSRNAKQMMDVTGALRKELEDKGLKGFKRGGKVKKTGKAKVHKGEYVIKAAAAKKAGPKKLASINRAAPKRAPAKKPAMRRGR